MQKPSVEQLRKSIDQARKAHDDPTVKALSDMLYEATGVHEPEFAPVESSGDPKLDSLRRALVQAVAARDEPTEATLRGMIKDIEGEPLPEVNVELTEEEPIENPFLPQEYIDKYDVSADGMITIPEEPEYEDPAFVPVKDIFSEVLGATQIAALADNTLGSEYLLREYIEEAEDKMEALILIKGIGRASAKTILEALGYEA